MSYSVLNSQNRLSFQTGFNFLTVHDDNDNDNDNKLRKWMNKGRVLLFFRYFYYDNNSAAM